MTPDEALAVLRATPSRIADAVAGAPPDRLAAGPAPGEWSAVEVLAHLRACADVWGGCIATLVAEDEPTIRAVNPRTWIEETAYATQDFAPSLQAFTAQRAELLALLEGLAPAGWERRATVTGAGSPRTKTVLDYAERLARHERPHVGQIVRAVVATAAGR